LPNRVANKVLKTFRKHKERKYLLSCRNIDEEQVSASAHESPADDETSLDSLVSN